MVMATMDMVRPKSIHRAAATKVCYYWLAGRCERHPCPYLHTDTDKNNSSTSFVSQNPKNHNKVCSYFLAGNCKYGEKCRFLHSWFTSDCFSLVAALEGHKKAITGIVLPTGYDKLCSSSKDGSVRLWDCRTGQCTGVYDLQSEVRCIISEGPWIFVGVSNAVKAWNTQTEKDVRLDCPAGAGQVYALTVSDRMLFAGTHDGHILSWMARSYCFEAAASMSGHQGPVVSLIVGAGRLYSGSMDHTIRVWDLTSLSCVQTLSDHTSVVMSLLCWDQFLISCSLDNSVKVWAMAENGMLQVTFTHNEQLGVLALAGLLDAESKPVLLCSCNDNTLRLYDLPSFQERGSIFAREEIRTIQVGPDGLFFTGDGAGDLKVWKWSNSSSVAICA